MKVSQETKDHIDKMMTRALDLFETIEDLEPADQGVILGHMIAFFMSTIPAEKRPIAWDMFGDAVRATVEMIDSLDEDEVAAEDGAQH